MRSMSTSVTSATISAVLDDEFAVTMGLLVSAVLVILLAARELLIAAGGQRALTWCRVSLVAIIPLLFTFFTIVVVRILAVA